MSHREKVNALLEQAASVEEPTTKLRLIEEAARLADTHNDVELGFEVREQIVHDGTFNGFRDRALIAFTWLLGQCDRDPERFQDSDLLWQYKWVTSSLSRFASITRAQIEGTLADMAKRYQRNGIGLRPVWKLRCTIAQDMGDSAASAAAFEQWQRLPRGAMSDCVACEQDDLAEYHFFAGRLEEGLALMEPILKGRMRCAEIPHTTFGDILNPLVRLGRAAEAMEFHRQGYRMVSRNHEFTRTIADHIAFLGVTENHVRGVKLLEKHLEWMLRSPHDDDAFFFADAARFLLERVKRKSLTLRLPKAFEGYRRGGTYEIGALRDWFAARATAIAAKFNARNGNDFFTTLMGNTTAMHGMAAKIAW